ncbi:hypothetical protein BDZ89DRAFT_1045940 [Hymenopellis radicata]|nr:hypothetical protein BDZ89DRAFT_1045940 [Hymenopellis radicata]
MSQGFLEPEGECDERIWYKRNLAGRCREYQDMTQSSTRGEQEIVSNEFEYKRERARRNFVPPQDLAHTAEVAARSIRRKEKEFKALERFKSFWAAGWESLQLLSRLTERKMVELLLMEHLPPEILEQIFLEYVAGHRKGWSVFNTVAGPGLLAAGWAIPTPSLGFELFLNDAETIYSASTVSHWYPDMSNKYHNFLVKIIELLMEWSPQWEEVHVFNSNTTPTLFSVPGYYPQLRSIELFLHPDAVSSGATHTFGFIEGPRLNDVKIYNISLLRVNLPFSQLRSLVHHAKYYSASSVPTAIEILDRCPKLELFDFDPECIDVHQPPPPERLEHGLKSLLTADIALLQVLKLSKLQSLSVMPSQHGPRGALFKALPYILDFVQASRCCLSTLRIDDCLLEIEALAAILDLNPSLVKFSIHISIRHGIATRAWIEFNMREAIKMLTQVTESAEGNRTPTLVPHLKIMEYFDHVNTEAAIGFIDSAFVDVLHVRYRSDGEGLKRVDVVTECGRLVN